MRLINHFSVEFSARTFATTHEHAYFSFIMNVFCTLWKHVCLVKTHTHTSDLTRKSERRCRKRKGKGHIVMTTIATAKKMRRKNNRFAGIISIGLHIVNKNLNFLYVCVCAALRLLFIITRHVHGTNIKENVMKIRHYVFSESDSSGENDGDDVQSSTSAMHIRRKMKHIQSHIKR